MLKDIIEKFIRQNNSVARFVKDASELYQDGQDILPSFIDKLGETNFHSELGNSFAEILQLSDEPEVYEQFELSNISRLYDSLRELQESNIDTFIDSGYFEFSVMDNSSKAQEITMEGLKMAKEKVQALEELLKQIDAGNA